MPNCWHGCRWPRPDSHHYGVEPGDRVALWLPNSTALLITALGCLWLGAPFVPLSPNDPHARLARAVADCDPAVIVGSDDGGHNRPDPNAFGGRRMVDAQSLLESGNGPVPPQQRDPGEGCVSDLHLGDIRHPQGCTDSRGSFSDGDHDVQPI